MTEADWLASDNPTALLSSLGPKKRDAPRVLKAARVVDEMSARQLRLFAVACCRQVWRLIEDERNRKVVEVAERYADGLATEEEMEIGWFTNTGCANSDARDSVPRALAFTSDLGLSGVNQAALLRCIAGYPYRKATLCGGREFPCSFCSGTGVAYAVDAILPGGGVVNPRPKECLCCGGTKKQTHFTEVPCSACEALRTPQVVGLAQAAYEDRLTEECPECAGRGGCFYDTLEQAGQWYKCRKCGGSGRITNGLLDTGILAALHDALLDAGCDNADVLTHLRPPSPEGHVQRCGTVFRGCAPECPRDRAERAQRHVRGCWVVDLCLGKE